MTQIKKVAILSPQFPPMKGGVSDYSLRLAEYFRSQGVEVLVLSNNLDQDVENIWTPHMNLQSGLSQLKEWSPDVIFVQYTPLSFAPETYGVTWEVVSLIKKLKGFSKVFLMAHEANYPVEVSLKGFLLGIPHYIQFHFLCRNADYVGFSMNQTMEYWRKWPTLNEMKMHLCPIFSNIRVSSQANPKEQAHQKWSIDTERPVIFYFGGRHTSVRFDYIWELARKNPNAQYVFAGVKDLDIPNDLKDELKIYLLGKLAEEDVSLLFQISDLVVAPFEDGVSSRRGSVMAGLSHGRPVLTTKGSETTSETLWEEGLMMANSRGEFVELGSELLNNKELQTSMAEKAARFYASNFALQVIGDKLLSLKLE